MSARLLVVALALFLPFSALANLFTVGQRLPPVGVYDAGEVIASAGDMDYQPWNSVGLTGRVRVVMHLAGRLSARDENAPLSAALAAAHLPPTRFQTSIIVNADDAIPGSAVFVRASLRSAKRESPSTQFIIDNRGAVKRAWQLTPGSAAVVVVDSAGLIRFAKEGALTPAEINQVLSLLHQLLQ